ncbi:hypothetical protein PAXINDRAFT_96702, partial [Paxillus involutus ATCC 200175]
MMVSGTASSPAKCERFGLIPTPRNQFLALTLSNTSMSSSIGEPFQLHLSSTFSQKTTANHQAVYTTYNSNFRGYATVTGQADCIHVWNLQNLHSVASYSVGEHVSFSAPAFSRCVVEDGSRSVVSYAVISQAPDIVNANRGRTIWVIKQGLSGPRSVTTEKSVVVVPYTPVRICGTPNDSLPLLLVSTNGSLCLANAEVEIKSKLHWPGERELVETFVFPRNSCSFIQDDSASDVGVAVICCYTRATIHVRLVLLREEIVLVGACELSIAGATSDTCVLGLTCSPSGVLSFIDIRGVWATYQLSCSSSSLAATALSENLKLRRFTILRNRKRLAGDGLVTVSLGSSLVLLAALVEGTEDITLQLWDLRYGVVLATREMPAPSVPSPHFSLSVADGQVLLTSTPSLPPSKNPGSPPRSSIHVIPVDPHLKSSLAAALGKSASTAEWLVPKIPDAKEPAEDDGKAKLISAIETSICDKKTQKADQAFFAWVKSHPSDVFIFGHEFVKKIVSIVLPLEPRTDHQYSPRIMRYLLEKGFVTNIMLEGKLLTTLRARGDWENLMLALNTVADISEDEMMASTKFLVDKTRKGDNAMEVDASEGYV